MSATNRYINWSGVGYTPTGGSLTAINSVTDMNFGRTGHAEKFKGDAATFFQAIAVPTQERTIEIHTADVKAAEALTIGSRGVLAATLGDFKNGTAASGGGFTLTATGAVLLDNTAQGPHAKTGMATLKFECEATDGTTDPFSVVAL